MDDEHKRLALQLTALDLIEAAVGRASYFEDEAKLAIANLKTEQKLLREYMVETSELSKSLPPDIQQTADTLMDFVYSRMDRANWNRDFDSEDPRDEKDRCAAWLGLKLQEAIDAALKKQIK